MKRLLAILIGVFGIVHPLWAEHIKGGELFYTYVGPASDGVSSIYSLTLKLYIDCNASSTGQLDPEVPLTVFNKSNNSFLTTATAPFRSETFISFDPNSNPCIGNPPRDVCYRIRIYTTNITLTNSASGYTVAYQRCCRIRGIINLNAPSDASGATYYCEIPGSNVMADAFKNSGVRFSTNDAVAICSGSAFTWNFSATDDDKTDSIVYAFCSGYSGATQAVPNPPTAGAPPYNELSYTGAYSGSSPLGPKVKIDRTTGIISGIAPTALGQYVVTVCAYEYRLGVLINVHKKDIHVRVSDCIPLRAFLQPDYSYCDDFLVSFKNEQANPPGSLYIWEYGDMTKPDTSTDAQGLVTHQFASAGTYTVKLKVILAGQCVDSTTTQAKVYPGFYPGFTTLGTCVLLPLQFTDTTKARYGAASKWSWNFGDESTLADTSHASTPQWKYATTGFKDVQLIVESDKGCIDTVIKKVEVRDKPPIDLAFKDTLICSIDTLELKAGGNGIFSWGPSYNIINPNTPNPLVYPKTTTVYQVTLNENGCVNTEPVRVRVVDFVTLDAGVDTTICLTDDAQLRPLGDGLKFVWTPAASLNDARIRNPIATPTATTTYTVEASIGKCSATDQVTVKTVAYPISDAGPDTTVCYDDTALLHASMVGSRFTWTPFNSLSDPSILNPLAFPRRTTTYVLRVYDVLGCPKPGVSDVVVTVKPKINAFAGNDTSIVVGQPLALNGSGAEFFEWDPPIGLNRRDISQPVAILNDNVTYVMKAFTIEGCFAYDTINVKVFKTQPDIFMPNAFNPSGTRNPVLRPVMAGISTLEYFRVYNRWGQMVFQTIEAGKGWDGTVGGKAQDAGTYVWMVRGKDYTGKIVTKKGTAVLIR
jgi:PKD repeat protein